MDDDFIALFGTDSAQGMQVHPRRFWSSFSGPVGPTADLQRQRLLAVFRTIPVPMRDGFLMRLHSEELPDAIGAWAELEFAHLATNSGLSVTWTDEQSNAQQGRRSVDLVLGSLGAQLHAEVTHYLEEAPPPSAMQMFSFFGKERVSAGLYALVVGSGQPPIRKLRALLRRSLASRPNDLVEVHVDDWAIRQLPHSNQAGENEKDAIWLERAERLIDRIRIAMKEKRRQARDAGLKDIMAAIVLADRHSIALVDLLSRHPERLTSVVLGSNREPSDLSVHAIAIGAVPFDQFPWAPNWTLFVANDNQLIARLTAPRVVLPIELAPIPHGQAFAPCMESQPERSVYYANVKVVQAPGREGNSIVTELE